MIDIQNNIPLAPHTTFCVGGPARFFAEANSEKELIEALKYAEENNLEFFILGGGSNLLVSDKGFGGLVIKIKIMNCDLRITGRGGIVKCGSGLPLARVVNESADNGLSGMEWAAGIPGTMGGAVRGNAGAFGKCIADTVESVKVLDISNIIQNSIPPSRDNEKLKIFNKKDCQFGYRTSIFKENQNLIILSAGIKLQAGNKKEIQNKISEILEKRKAKQPQGTKSAGSFFVNPVVADEKLREEFERDSGVKFIDKKIPAGWLIDQAGLRGKKIGGAMVSEEHANFIINTGEATAEDVIILASLIKQQVRNKFKVQLQEEVRYLGF